MAQSDKQKGGTKLRIDPDIEEEVWIKTVKLKTPLNRIVNAMLRAWVSTPAAQVPPAPVQNPIEDSMKTAQRLVEQLGSLQSQTETLAQQVQDAAAYLKGIINDGISSTDARAATGRERLEENILHEMAEVNRSTGAAITDAASPNRSPAGAHQRTTRARGVKKAR